MKVFPLLFLFFSFSLLARETLEEKFAAQMLRQQDSLNQHMSTLKSYLKGRYSEKEYRKFFLHGDQFLKIKEIKNTFFTMCQSRFLDGKKETYQKIKEEITALEKKQEELLLSEVQFFGGLIEKRKNGNKKPLLDFQTKNPKYHQALADLWLFRTMEKEEKEKKEKKESTWERYQSSNTISPEEQFLINRVLQYTEDQSLKDNTQKLYNKRKETGFYAKWNLLEQESLKGIKRNKILSELIGHLPSHLKKFITKLYENFTSKCAKEALEQEGNNSYSWQTLKVGKNYCGGKISYGVPTKTPLRAKDYIFATIKVKCSLNECFTAQQCFKNNQKKTRKKNQKILRSSTNAVSTTSR